MASVKAFGDKLVVTLNFMGLLGSTSPLPAYFLEPAHRDAENSRSLSDFLAVFNNRIYALFYLAWKKHSFTSENAQGSAISSVLRALRGEFGNGVRPHGFAELFVGRIRSASALEALLSAAFDSVPIRIKQWAGRWFDVPDVAPLGSACRLGINALAGTRMWDNSASFRIIVGPLTRSQFETFLPGRACSARLVELVQCFLADPLSYELEIRVAHSELIPIVLGSEECRLGVCAALGEAADGDRTDCAMHAIVYEPAPASGA